MFETKKRHNSIIWALIIQNCCWVVGEKKSSCSTHSKQNKTSQDIRNKKNMFDYISGSNTFNLWWFLVLYKACWSTIYESAEIGNLYSWRGKTERLKDFSNELTTLPLLKTVDQRHTWLDNHQQQRGLLPPMQRIIPHQERVRWGVAGWPWFTAFRWDGPY